MTETRTYTALAYLGAIPFVVSALSTIFGGPFSAELVERVAVSYGLAIVSFLAGVHWGLYLRHSETVGLNLFVSSNLILLAVWFLFLIGSVRWALLSQLLALTVLLVIDYQLVSNRVTSRHYWSLRVSVTVLAVASLGSMVVFG